jgi:6-phosphogluconate dehydrogenase
MDAHIGLIGLATMGANFARNIANKGFYVCVYNRTTEKTDMFLADHGSENLMGAKTLEEFVSKLQRPRKIIVLVKAGEPVDKVGEQLLPLLDEGDIIIDCGNSNYNDTVRRVEYFADQGIHFLGSGISGGEEGALHGPSLMPGGPKEAYDAVEEIFTASAARDFSGGPCCTYIGAGGSGHYVKMVHNGIEYAVVQLIAEAYDILRKVFGLTAPEIGEIFGEYNKDILKSYLFEIAEVALKKEDEFVEKAYLIDFILDKAGQKGTGRWTAIDALKRGVSLPTITEAVFARVSSSEKKLRTQLAGAYDFSAQPDLEKVDLDAFKEELKDALYAAILVSYAQGYDLIQKASETEDWQVDLSEVSRIWQGGCIIRAEVLKTLTEAFKKDNKVYLLGLEDLKPLFKSSISSLKSVSEFSLKNHVAIPCFSASLSYFVQMTQANSSANMIQAMRDLWGAHTYERTDREGTFHTDWL